MYCGLIQQEAQQHTALCSLIGLEGGEKSRIEERRFTNKTKTACPCIKQNRGLIHNFPLAGRCSATSRKAGLTTHNSLLEDKCHHSRCYLFLLSPSFIAKHDILWYRISLWLVWVSCPPWLLVHLQPHCWQSSARS